MFSSHRSVVQNGRLSYRLLPNRSLVAEPVSRSLLSELSLPRYGSFPRACRSLISEVKSSSMNDEVVLGFMFD